METAQPVEARDLTPIGLDEEAIRLAENRMAAINRAWDEINGKKAA